MQAGGAEGVTERFMRLAAQTPKRSSKAELETLYERLRDIISEQAPCTVRQVFYRATVAGLGPKEERFYGRVGRYLVNMRERGMIPFGDIADNTRWMRKPRSYSSLRAMLEETKQIYRRALWRDQDAYVELWLEKDALSGVLFSVTSEWDVPLMVTRGYASLSFLHGAAEAIRDQYKPVHIYYFGDYDPSGIDIPQAGGGSIETIRSRRGDPFRTCGRKPGTDSHAEPAEPPDETVRQPKQDVRRRIR
jgi:hypothetical protein